MDGQARGEVQWFSAAAVPRFSAVPTRRSPFGSPPDVEVLERAHVIVVTAHVPTVPASRLRVTATAHRVTLTAAPADAPPEGVPPWDIAVAGFERVICSHAELEPESVRATYRNGTLEVVVPKVRPGGEGVHRVRGE